MAQHKIVARYRDGSMVKGHTNNFYPESPSFVLTIHDAPADAKPVQVDVRQLKAIFFVKDFLGRRNYQKKNDFAAGQPYQGRRAEVTFTDGEMLRGSTPNYDPRAQGFFFFPADGDANTTKVYVVNASVEHIEMLPEHGAIGNR